MIKVLLLAAWLAAVSPLLPATPKAKRPAPWTRRGAAVDAGDAPSDEGIDDAGGASLAELLKRAGATRTEVAAARKIRAENAEVIEYLLDDAGFTAQDVSEMLATKPALARTALVEPPRSIARTAPPALLAATEPREQLAASEAAHSAGNNGGGGNFFFRFRGIR